MSSWLLGFDDEDELYSLVDPSAYHDAWSIWGRDIDDSAPSDGEALVWSAAHSQWEPGTSSGGAPAAHEATHLPLGADALTTAAPGPNGVASVSYVGSANSIARSDHRHKSDTAPENVDCNAAAKGTSGEPARADHKHDVNTGTPTVIGVATTSYEGNASTLARSDHRHKSDTVPSDVTKATAAKGTSGEPARADHKHDVSTAAPGAIALGDSAAEGTATTLARSDHRHSTPASWNDGRIVKTLTNRTGSASVLGQVVVADDDNDLSYIVAPAGTIFAMGVVLEAGVANGSATKICLFGDCQVLFGAGVDATRQRWASMSLSDDGCAVSDYVADGNVYSQGLGMTLESVVGDEFNPSLVRIAFCPSQHAEIPVARNDS